jgi:3',5'-cyclic AMP phosphodiesterase CpdA
MATLIVQLSDLHMPAGGLLFDAIDVERRLARCLDAVIASEREVAALLVTGDVADGGDPASYLRAVPILESAAARLGAKLIRIPGNHDDIDAFERYFGAPAECVVWLDGVRVVGLDSTAAGGHHGELSVAQLDRLAAELMRPAPSGTILALHHPPVPSPVGCVQGLQLRDPDALAEVIRGSDIRVILCGHDHHTSGAQFAGVPVWIAPSMAYTMDVLGADDRIQGTAHGAITLIEIHQDTVVITQMPVPDPAAGYVIDRPLDAMLGAYSRP